MEGIRQQYIDMVTRFIEAKWASKQFPMIEKFHDWYEQHQEELTDEEKKYLKDNIHLKRSGTRVIFHAQ